MDSGQVYLIRTRDRSLDGPLTASNLKKRAMARNKKERK